MVQAQKGYFRTDGHFVPETLLSRIPANQTVTIIWETEANTEESESMPIKTIDEAELAKRRAMFESLRGCLAGQEIDLKEIRDERLKKRGLL